MPTLISAAVALLVVALAAPASAQASRYYGSRFPDNVAGVPRGEVIDFEKDHPGLGYGARCNAKRLNHHRLHLRRRHREHPPWRPRR